MREVFGYCNGVCEAIENCPDPVFAEMMMGDGFRIVPDFSSSHITAPFDGKVIATVGTKHAIGICDSFGNEFLIHVGIDTIRLKGKGFKILKKVGSEFKAGDKLMKVDWKYIKSQQLDCSVMLISTDGKLSNIIKSIGITSNSDTVLGSY